MGGTTAARSTLENEARRAAMGGADTKSAEDNAANASKWEFRDRKALLYALVGNDFGADPESRLEEIREYKKNEAKFLLQALRLKAQDRVLDLGSGFGFIARVTAPLVERVWCVDISNEFLECAKQELREFSNVQLEQMEFADLRFLAGRGINKGYANAVFIHFNFFDITLYLRELFAILEPGGIFVFGMSDSDSLDIRSDRYFGVVLEKYKEHRGSPVLMHWNSAKAVCRAAEALGFQAKNAYSGGGTAMIVLEKPGTPMGAAARTPESAKAFSEGRNRLAPPPPQEHHFCERKLLDRDERNAQRDTPS